MLTESVAEMICFAYEDRFEKLPFEQQQNIIRWSKSIIEYVKTRP